MIDVFEVRDNFISDLKNDNVEDITEWLDSLIDNEVIYTSDCYEIMSNLMITDFDEYIMNFGEVKTIQSLAWFYLREHILENIEIDDLEQMKELYNRYQEIQNEIEELDEEDEDEQEEIRDLKSEMEDIEEELGELDFEF